MVLLSAAFQREADGGAGRDTVVRRIVRGECFKLRDCVLRWQNVDAAGAATVIRFAAVDQPDVVALAKTIHADVRTGAD